MKNIKSFFHTLKSYFDNKKLRGIVQIMFWIIFFIFVFIIFKMSDNKKLEVKNDSKVKSYEYNYQYVENNNINNCNITGTYYNGKEVFYLNNNKFYFINNNYYDINNKLTNIIYSTIEWQYPSLKKIMDNNKYSNKVSYNSGTSKYEYKINKDIYNDYYNTNYQNDILLTITKKNDKINCATINYSFGIVNITYKNINEINNLDININ